MGYRTISVTSTPCCLRIRPNTVGFPQSGPQSEIQRNSMPTHPIRLRQYADFTNRHYKHCLLRRIQFNFQWIMWPCTFNSRRVQTAAESCLTSICYSCINTLTNSSPLTMGGVGGRWERPIPGANPRPGSCQGLRRDLN